MPKQKRETMIVFVYDTEYCKDEADDPVNAVMYFHPSWVSDTQKVALCGQLMGTSYFLKDCFFKPRIIALQNGKFVFKEFGRFILAVGTDRNISDHLLEQRADLLSSLVKFFHRDLQTIYDQFFASGQGQYKNLSEKLYHIFETYLPILQYNGNIFQNVPRLKIPKSASNIFLDAIQTLQSCQQTKGILGGAILYHNKVVASQLSAILTKNLVLTDPHRIKSTAEQLSSVDFHIPIGVQMIAVYIPTDQYRKLSSDAHRSQNLQTQNFSNIALPFQYQKQRKIKRDKSIIFSNIPEEGSSCAESGAITEESDAIEETTLGQPPIMKPKNLVRPNHLPLRFKNVTSKELPESGFASINFDETDSYPEFIGRTSVCSTPMTENKVMHGNIMSICLNPTEGFPAGGGGGNSSSKTKSDTNRKNSLKIDFDKFFANFISNPNKIERRNSFTDMQDSLKKISQKLSLKKFSNGFNAKTTDVNRNGSTSSIGSPGGDENDSFSSSSSSSDDNNKTSQTITDPTYPVFNSNGKPISRSLFQEFLEKYYNLWDENSKKDEQIAKLIEEFKEFDSELKKLDDTLKHDNDETGLATGKPDRNLNIATRKEEIVQAAKTPLDKKSMSLPLKPLSDTAATNAPADAATTFGTFGERKRMGGIPLTPLMAKLSVLALNEERPSGFYSWDATPGVDMSTPVDGTKIFRRKSSIKIEDIVDKACFASAESSQDGLQKVELYICGQQNMTMLLLMEEGSGRKQEIVQAMFEICVAKLTRMESHLNQTLNINLEGDKSDGDYSFICLDSKWDALQRNGPWTPVDMTSLEFMHRDLNSFAPITELLLRTSDSVLYGYKSGRTEFFYKEGAHQTAGIPPPSDPMGNISMRAKRRLERDHSYILF